MDFSGTWPAMGSVDRYGQYNAVSCTFQNNLEHNEASFPTISTDLLCLRVAQMPNSQDLVIFVLLTDNRQNTLPLAHARRYKFENVPT